MRRLVIADFLLRGRVSSPPRSLGWRRRSSARIRRPRRCGASISSPARQVHERRQLGRLVVSSVAVAVVAVALLVFALISRGQAVKEKTCRELAGTGRGEPDRSSRSIPAHPSCSRSARSAPDRRRRRSWRSWRGARRVAVPAGVAGTASADELPARRRSNLIAYRPDPGKQIAEGFCNDGVSLVGAHRSRDTAHHRSRRCEARWPTAPTASDTLAIGGARGVALYDERAGKILRTLRAPVGISECSSVQRFRRIGVLPRRQEARGRSCRRRRAVRPRERSRRVVGARDVPSPGRSSARSSSPPGARFLVVGTSQSYVTVLGTQTGALSSASARRCPVRVRAGDPGDDSRAGTLFVGTNPCGRRYHRLRLEHHHVDAPNTPLGRFGNISVTSLAPSRDGSRLAIGESNGTASVWSLATRVRSSWASSGSRR